MVAFLPRVEHLEFLLEQLLGVWLILLLPIDSQEVGELWTALPLSDLDDDTHYDVL